MDKQDKRYIAAFALLVLGFMLLLGTVGDYEFDGYMAPAEFIVRTLVALLLMGAALPVSGDLDELFELLAEKRKNRR